MTGPLPVRRGWCPGLFEPMESGDGWLLRVKPRRGRLAAADARLIAAAARRDGNGWLNVTGRGNLQLRGFDRDGASRFAAAMVEAGLASKNPGEERRRNLLLPPLAVGLEELAEALEQVLADPALAALPGKVGLLLERDDALAGIAADLRIELAGEVARCRIAGGTLGWRGPVASVPAVVAGLLAGFLAVGRGLAVAPRRLRDVPAAWLLDAAGLDGVVLPAAAAGPAQAVVGDLGGAVSVMPAFGQGVVGLLDALASLAERCGDGVLRVTPWRTIVLAGLTAGADVLAEAASAGLIVSPGDPRLRITACTGAPGCLQGSVDVQADAGRLAPRVAALGVPALHLSGCAKGCAHPEPAALTLVGRGGRYGLVRDGRAGDPVERDGLDLVDVLAGKEGEGSALDPSRVSVLRTTGPEAPDPHPFGTGVFTRSFLRRSL